MRGLSGFIWGAFLRSKLVRFLLLMGIFKIEIDCFKRSKWRLFKITLSLIEVGFLRFPIALLIFRWPFFFAFRASLFYFFLDLFIKRNITTKIKKKSNPHPLKANGNHSNPTHPTKTPTPKKHSHPHLHPLFICQWHRYCCCYAMLIPVCHHEDTILSWEVKMTLKESIW